MSKVHLSHWWVSSSELQSLDIVRRSLEAKGLGLVEDIKTDLVSTLRRTGRDSLSEIVGADAATITAEPWPE